MDKDINNIVTAKTEQIKKLQEIVKRSIEDESLIINNLLNPPKEFVTKGYYKETDEEHYTGEICHRVITYKLNLADDLVVLGLARK